MSTTPQSWLKEHAWNPFAGVDLRSLALFRIALAITCLANIALYWPSAGIFFADFTGFLLRSEAIRNQSPYNWSLLYINNSPAFIHLFFIVYFLSALGMLLGYRTRLMTLLCWACSVSLRTRAVGFISLADTQLVILLFWGMFLPLGARLSVDSALRKTPYAANHYASIASLGLVLNIAYLYFFGALEKTGAPWVQGFDAVFLALSNIETTTPLAPYLLALGAALKPLTMLIYYLELFAILLIFLPAHTQAGRMVVVPLLILLHLGFAAGLSIGIFPLVSLAGLCALLPAMFWENILPRFNARPRRRGIAMYYDRECEFCLKCCLIFRSLGLPPTTQILPAQDDAEAGPILARENSWVVKTHDNQLLTGWDAVSYIWRRSPLLFPLGWLFWLPGFRQLGHALYRLIAARRPQLARATAAWLPRHEQPLYRPSRGTALILALLAMLVLLGNINNIYGGRDTWPRTADMILRFAALDQRWGMYAPFPTKSSNWLVVEGTLERGDRVDMMHLLLTPPSHAKPAHGWELFPDFRWRKYFSRIDWPGQGARIVGYYCRQWEARYPDIPLQSVEIFSYRQLTEPHAKPEGKGVFKGTCRARNR